MPGRVIAFEANGARAAIELSSPDLLGPVATHSLPLGWAPRSPQDADRLFGLADDDERGFAVSVDGEVVYRDGLLDTALASLRSYVFGHVLERSPERLFVHAGCVGHRGRAILLPGARNLGKSTLVAALVRAGASYYTDDYLPLDPDGLAHPYPLPLWITDPETGRGAAHPVESLGGVAAREPLRIGVVARIAFREGGAWNVRELRRSEGALLVLAHSLGHARRPEFALAAARRATDEAVVLEGQRGGADEAAEALLEIAETTMAR